MMFETSQRGILKAFNDVWIILESKEKGGNELIYYRITNIRGVVGIK